MAEYLSKEDMNTGEYISRDEILKAIHSYCEKCDNYNGVMCRACDNAEAMDIIIDIPAADVQPVKRGRWTWDSNAPYREHGAYKCSNCGCHSDFEENYCYNCGARKVAELEAKHHNECGQIAQYSDENAKMKKLLRKAVEDMNNSVNDVHCKYCSKWHTDQCQGTSHLDCYIENKFKWRHADEALALIGEDGEQNG